MALVAGCFCGLLVVSYCVGLGLPIAVAVLWCDNLVAYGLVVCFLFVVVLGVGVRCLILLGFGWFEVCGFCYSFCILLFSVGWVWC